MKETPEQKERRQEVTAGTYLRSTWGVSFVETSEGPPCILCGFEPIAVPEEGLCDTCYSNS